MAKRNRKRRSAWGSLTEVSPGVWRRRIKKAGRSPLVNYLFDVLPSKSSCRFLLSFADSYDTARVTPRFPRRFCCALELPDGIPIIINKGNCPLIVWQCWRVWPSLICNLLLHADPTAIFRGVWAIVVDAIKCASHTRRVIVIASSQRPFFERRETVSPLVANCNSTPPIPRIIRSVLVIAAGFHASPDAIQPVCFRWNICVQLIYAFFHSLCNSLWSCTFTTRERPMGCKGGSGDRPFRAARTFANPMHVILLCSWGGVYFDNCPSPKRESREIFYPPTCCRILDVYSTPASATSLSATNNVSSAGETSIAAITFPNPHWFFWRGVFSWFQPDQMTKTHSSVVNDFFSSAWVDDVLQLRPPLIGV